MTERTGLKSKRLNKMADGDNESTSKTSQTLLWSGLGLLLASGAGMSTACVSTITKLLKNDVSFWEVAFYRGIMNSTLAYSYLVVTGRGNLFRGLDRSTLAVLILRSLMFLCAVVISFAVHQNIPLGDASALMGTSTVMTGFLGIFLLKEKWHLPEMLMGLLCWAGVLLVSRPASLFGTTEGAATDADGTSIYYLLALVSSIMTSLSFLLVRKIGKSVDVARVLLFAEMTSMMFCFCVLWTNHGVVKPPLPNSWIYLPWLSILSILVQALMNLALRIEKASTAVVFRTAGMVTTSFLMQTFFFKSVPEVTSVAGALLILTSTALLSFQKMKQEKVKQK